MWKSGEISRFRTNQIFVGCSVIYGTLAMEDVKVWLSSNGLGEYWPNFEKHGWEELSLLTEMSEVDLEMCITKRGHRAKFRKALRSLTNASASSGNAERPSHADERQKYSCEVGPMPLESTDHATPSLLADTTTKIERTELKCSIQVEDRTEPIETVWKIYKTGTDQKDAVREVDNTDSDQIDAAQEIDNADLVAIVQDMKAILRIADNRTESEADVTVLTRNEVSRYQERPIASR